MTRKIYNLINTIRYLKTVQVVFRLFYFARKIARKITGFRYPLTIEKKSCALTLINSIDAHSLYADSNNFTFLNLSKEFNDKIDWNFNEYGKLWTYNLTYFEFINQKEFSQAVALRLINDFIKQSKLIKDGYEPAPTSIRGINWIKYLIKNNIKDVIIDASLYAQYRILYDNIEYHLLGNHLLENGFSLLFGAYYFNDSLLYEKAKEILTNELNEQILSDGAHFELAPMYHQIMLYRVLDSYNLVKNNESFNKELLTLLRQKAEIMLGWLKEVTFNNGEIPLLNDSANEIAPTSSEIFEYASRLGLTSKKIILKECGYRKICKPNYEMIVDVGNIGPDYIPGHAHSDTFNFELHINNNPFIVDTGISTYEANALRIQQRATIAHNTVRVGNKEQSEVWASFRVGRRAKIVSLEESDNNISSSHDGFKRNGNIHSRKFIFNDDSILIIDNISGIVNGKCFSYLHFHPSQKLKIDKNTLLIGSQKINFKFANKLILTEYEYAPQYNHLIKASLVIAEFSAQLETEIIV